MLGWAEFGSALARAPLGAKALALLLVAALGFGVWYQRRVRFLLEMQLAALSKEFDDLLTRDRIVQEEYVRLQNSVEPIESMALHRYPDRGVAYALNRLAKEFEKTAPRPETQPGAFRKMVPWLRSETLLRLVAARQGRRPLTAAVEIVVANTADPDGGQFVLASELIGLLHESGIAAKLERALPLDEPPSAGIVFASEPGSRALADDVASALSGYLSTRREWRPEGALSPGRLRLFIFGVPSYGPDGTIGLRAGP